MKATLLVIFALFAVTSARQRLCDRGVLGPFPLDLRITHCPDPNTTCRIIRGTDIINHFDFVASELEILW
jgi:hypothetical protein